MFPGHLSCVELLLQKDIFLPPFLFVAFYEIAAILLHNIEKAPSAKTIGLKKAKFPKRREIYELENIVYMYT